MHPSAAVAALALLLAAAGSLRGVAGRTEASQTAILLKFKQEMLKRPGYQWGLALKSWACPTPAASSDNLDGACDPCGKQSWWGNFDHLGCRGDTVEAKDVLGGNGFVTNVHVTDYNITGAVPAKELCALKHLKEFDVDGGQLTGTIPVELSTCFPEIDEIDLSYNKLTGTIPAWLGGLTKLDEFKVEHNHLTGTLPAELGNMTEIKWLRFGNNELSGSLPASLVNIATHLVQFTVDSNSKVGGTLHPLSNASLINVGTESAPGLCGMVPVGLRFAHGFNHYGTQLGLPCPEDLEAGWTELSETLD